MEESEKEKIERLSLTRELKISQLMLNSKKYELEKENRRNIQLEKEKENIKNNEEIKKQIEQLKKQLYELNSINKIIENENKKKSLVKEELHKKLMEDKPVPVESKDNNTEIWEEDDKYNKYTFI